MSERLSILFVCIHNAGRSQMAAGFARHLGGERVAVFSGGSEPAAKINPRALAVMAELGIDIAREIPRLISDEVIQAADAVITMGCGDACPIYPGKRYIDWELDDPADADLAGVRRIRDDIRARVEQLLVELAALATS